MRALVKSVIAIIILSTTLVALEFGLSYSPPSNPSESVSHPSNPSSQSTTSLQNSRFILTTTTTNTTPLVENSNKTCTVAATVTQNNTTGLLTLCHVASFLTTTIIYTNNSIFTTYPANSFVSNSSASLNSTNLTCVQTAYQVLGIGSVTVQNGTTQMDYRTTTSTLSETTFTTTTNVTQSVGYVTTTTNYQPPSAWSVVVCSYEG
jgi:hypothetical protein